MKYLCFHGCNGQPQYEQITAKFANELKTMGGVVFYNKIVNRELKAIRWREEQVI